MGYPPAQLWEAQGAEEPSLMSTRRKIALTFAVALAASLIILVALVPRLVDLDRYRPQVISRIEQRTGRRTEISRLGLSIVPVLSVRADGVAVGNPPGFPSVPFLQIQRLYAELDTGALLHREIVIRSLKLEDPSLSLLANAEGHWNFENPAVRVRPAAWVAEPAASIAVSKVEIGHGRVTIARLLPSGGAGPTSFELSDVAVELEDVNPGALGLNLGSGTNGLNRRALSFFRPATLSQPAPRDVTPQPGGSLAAHGTWTAESARSGGLEATRIKSALSVYEGGVLLDGLTMELCGGRVTGRFGWISRPQPGQYNAQLAFAQVDMARLLAAFPSAAGKMTGKMEGRIKLTGRLAPSADPLASQEGTGEITVRDGQLPTLQLNKNLLLLMRDVIDLGPASRDPSSFRSISADLEIAREQIESRHITILGNGVDVDASGTLALGGGGWIDYQGLATLTAKQNAFTNVLAGLLGSKIAGGKLTFPFTLTGTLAAPRFGLKRNPLRR